MNKSEHKKKIRIIQIVWITIGFVLISLLLSATYLKKEFVMIISNLTNLYIILNLVVIIIKKICIKKGRY